MKMRMVWSLLVFFGGMGTNTAQDMMNVSVDAYGGALFSNWNNAENPCLTTTDYHRLEGRIKANLSGFDLRTRSGKQEKVMLEWPLRAANGLADCSFYVITAFVDQDISVGAIQDYHCGTRTYDGHRGTDIALFPYRFMKMDNDQVEVIAAAAGIILDKADGNADKNCGSNSLQANYIVIGHSDGSRALYFHMKKNSVTTKAVGESVAAGEYLGVVGSSGNSSGPHLHFEVWEGSSVATRIDPFAGTCNNLNSTSWWLDQKPYVETSVAKVSTNATDIVIPPCPQTELHNEQTCFSQPFQGPNLPAGYARFYMFLRHEIAGGMGTLRILNPDGSIYLSWAHNSTTDYATSWWGWSKKLPVQPGVYTFEATYNGTVCNSMFQVIDAKISPSGPIIFCEGDSVILSANEGSAFSWSNGQDSQQIQVTQPGFYQVTITGSGGCSSISPGVMIDNYTAEDDLMIIQAGDSLYSPYTNDVFWYKEGIAEPVDSGRVVYCHGDGLYRVTGLDQHGCQATSQSLNVTCPVTRLDLTGPPHPMRIIPNPTSGAVRVCLDNPDQQVIRLQLSDMTGNVLLDQRWTHEGQLHADRTVDLQFLPDGIYQVILQGNTWQDQALIVKVRN